MPLNALQERIITFLGGGMPATEVATIVGCSPSYISQLAKEDEFKEALKAKILENSTVTDEQQALDKRYESTEHLLLNAVKDKIPEASMGEIVRALEAIDKRKDTSHRRKHPSPVNPLGPAVNVNIVQLALPAQLANTLPQVAVEMNGQNEIVAIDGRALAPMSSAGVKNLFEQIRQKPVELVNEL
jgi:hypothetical protein